MEHYFSGRVDRLIFENQSNFYKILLVELEDTDSDYAGFEKRSGGTGGCRHVGI